MTFEAAARHGSFTSAARELGVTQAAVSRQVRILEQELGALLFSRSHRRVELTAAGSLLAGTLGSCFEKIRDTAELIRQPLQADGLTVGATIAFSHFWLLPRIAAFRAANPDTVIRIVTQDAPFDLTVDDVDVIVRFGSEPARGGEVLASVPDVVYPVAAPSFRERFAGPVGIAELRASPLLASDTPDPTWINWSKWLEAAAGDSVAVRPSLLFTTYTDCIQAAIAGQGVALGWGFLLGRLIETGQLVPFSDLRATPGGSYQLVASTRRRRSETVSRFIEWARAAFGETGGSTR